MTRARGPAIGAGGAASPALAGLLAVLSLCGGCGLAGRQPASPEEAARSFAPYRSTSIGAEDAETFLRRSWFVRVSPRELQRRIEQDRDAHAPVPSPPAAAPPRSNPGE